ncbi:hypothetical protein CQ010_01920 [Arthrobacter sp. MYb211]|nr:hypothetical protein CQ015_04175 [Arthrobacter sp. MYb221]PRC10624.1 hypothetical protein CQ010_01920 [Arthrobacter sp. MYb211]
MLAWFGLDGKAKNESEPPGDGVSEKTKWGSLLLCLALAFAVFAVAHWLLGGALGFASYVPGICAAGTLLIGSLISEHSLARGEGHSPDPHSRKN